MHHVLNVAGVNSLADLTRLGAEYHVLGSRAVQMDIDRSTYHVLDSVRVSMDLLRESIEELIALFVL
jgi:hypothetical protein